MKNATIGFYPNDEQRLAELWSQGLFVFDSSVLLGLYRYPEHTRKDLMTILHNLAPRIWIPHQVALEFQENRLSIIREQSAKYDEVLGLLRDAERKLTAKIQQLQLGTRHSLIKPSDLLPRISQTFDELINDIQALSAEHPELYQHDFIRAELDTLFEGRVGKAPETQQQLNEIYEEGLKRYDEQRPPGYKDAKKEDELNKRGEPTAYFYNGLRLEKQFGDLILWHQMLSELPRRKNVKYVAFVTDDEKEDWWWKEKSPSSRRLNLIGARPELVQEMTALPNISLFQMYKSDTFMEAAEKYLQLDISQDSIDDAREVIRRTSEVHLIRRVLEEKGAMEVWQDLDYEDVKIFVVGLDDERYGILVAEKASLISKLLSGIDWRERTSFVPSGGTQEEVREFLSKIAVRIEGEGSSSEQDN